MREFIAFLVLFIPLGWELIDDARNDQNKIIDVFIRSVLVILSAVYPWYIGHNYLASAFLSGAIFFLLFDYLIHIIMLRRRDWFSYLGATSKIDKIKWWIGLGAWGRFVLRLMIFIIALIWYFDIMKLIL